jgi:hypothetical protein
MAEEQLRTAALEYHEFPTPGKISVMPTKALANDPAGEVQGLIWRTREGGNDIDYDFEPARSTWQRIKVEFLSLLPLDRQL